MNKHNILIVEDDQELATLTRDFLNQFEFECQIEGNGANAIELILSSQPDLVLLDIMLPEVDGLQICQQIKQQYNGKIIMLTARTDTIDQVLGLELGADDYVSKPVEPRLLLARARAVLRRESQAPAAVEEIQRFNDITINRHKREVTKSGQVVELSNPEYDLFEFMTQNSGVVLSRDQIFKCLRGVEYDGLNRQVDIHVSSLRAKLEQDPTSPNLIKTVRSKGYLFTG